VTEAEEEEATVATAALACGGMSLLLISGVDMASSSVVNVNRSAGSGVLSGMAVFGSRNSSKKG
jgi:hypothetical protein